MNERKISELTEVTTLSDDDELVFVKYENGNPGPEPTSTPTPTPEIIDALEFRWFSDDELQEEPVLQVRNYEKPKHDNFKEVDTKSEWRTLYFFDGSEDVYDLEHSVWPDAGVKEEYPHEKEKTLDGAKITLRKNNNKNYLQIYVDGRAAFLFKNDNERKSMSIHRRVPGWPIIPKPGIEYAITIEDLSIDDDKTNTNEDNVTLSVSLIEGPDQWSYRLNKNQVVQVPQGTETTFSAGPGVHRVIVTPVNVVNGKPRQVGTPKELRFEVDDIVTIPEPPTDDCIVPLDICIVEEQLEQPMDLFEITGTNVDEKLDTDNDSVKVSLSEGCKIYLDTSKFTETPQQWPSDEPPNNDMQKTTSEFPVMVEFMDFRDSWRNFFGILYCAKVPTEPVDIYFEKNNVLYSANFIMPEWRGEAPSSSGNEVKAQHSIVRDWWSSRPKPFNSAKYWKVRVYGHKKGNTNVVGVSGTWKLNGEDGCYYNYDLNSGEVFSDSSAKDNDYKFKLIPLEEDWQEHIQIWDENEESDNDPFVLLKTYILGSNDEVTSTQKADAMGTQVHFAVDWDGYGKPNLDESGMEIWPPRFCWKQGQKLFARIGYSDFSNNENSYRVRVHPQPCEDVPSIMHNIVIDEIIVDKTITENNVLVKVKLVENPDHWHYVLDDEPVKMVMQGEEVTLTVEPGHHKIEVWPTNKTHDKVGHSRIRRFYVPGYSTYDESYYQQQ